jgi:hypothetical protein
MTKIPQLVHARSAHVHFDPRILEFIAHFILARTVNLAVLGNILNPNVKRESNQRHATRFLAYGQTWRDAVRDWLLGFFPDHITLAVDRTEWTFGNTPINLLVVAIVYNGFALPLGVDAPRQRWFQQRARGDHPARNAFLESCWQNRVGLDGSRIRLSQAADVVHSS